MSNPFLDYWTELKEGFVLRVGTILGGVTSESLRWAVAEVAREAEASPARVVFDVTYFGVCVGRWAVEREGDKLYWQEVRGHAGAPVARAVPHAGLDEAIRDALRARPTGMRLQDVARNARHVSLNGVRSRLEVLRRRGEVKCVRQRWMLAESTGVV